MLSCGPACYVLGVMVSEIDLFAMTAGVARDDRRDAGGAAISVFEDVTAGWYSAYCGAAGAVASGRHAGGCASWRNLLRFIWMGRCLGMT